MSLSLPETHKLPPSSTPTGRFALLRSWSLWWEVGAVLLVGAFLRFYQIQTTEFDEDQAMLFRMASDAVHHGLLPTTSNAASIGIANPPGVIYLFMLPASLSADPLWGTVMVGLFTIAAIILTYFFSRRYYGRLAGITAALLYATAAKPLNYARFIWQPNLMPPFVMLFLFALFLGVMERRKGWLFPALLLLGILYQMHAITLLLAIPLLCALVLAPGTLRWRDVGLAVVLLAIIFSPYVLWEFFTHFADLHTVFSLAKHPAHIDSQALVFYVNFLSPYDHQPTYAGSALFALAYWIGWLRLVMVLLVLGSFALASMLLLFPSRKQAKAPGTETATVPGGVRGWWRALRADPARCGLALLLVWQLVPLLILTRHSIDLHSQYFFMFMPGPFILIGILIARVVAFSQARMAATGGVDVANQPVPVPVLSPRQGAMLRYCMYALVVLVIGTQLVGSTAAVIDTSSGGFSDRSFQPYPYHNDLNSLRNALTSADQLAQQRHLNRVYVTVDPATRSAISYLSAFMRTPTTLFDASHCLVLPGPVSGTAVLLVGPYDTLTNALLGDFAMAHPVAQLSRVGGPPFRLYEVSPEPQHAASSSPSAFVRDLQALSVQTVALNSSKTPWLVTRWTMLRDAQPDLHTTYNYTVLATPLVAGGGQQSMQSACTFTTLRAGDQLLAAFNLPAGGVGARAVSLGVQSSMTQPYNPVYGPFHLETDASNTTPWTTLRTASGQESVTLTVL